MIQYLQLLALTKSGLWRVGSQTAGRIGQRDVPQVKGLDLLIQTRGRDYSMETYRRPNLQHLLRCLLRCLERKGQTRLKEGIAVVQLCAVQVPWLNENQSRIKRLNVYDL